MRHPSFPAAANIDFELGGQLTAVGIGDLTRLEELGAREAWLRLRLPYPHRGDARTLLRLQGAIDDVHVDKLPAAVAFELRAWWQRQRTDDSLSAE